MVINILDDGIQMVGDCMKFRIKSACSWEMCGTKVDVLLKDYPCLKDYRI